MVKQMPKGFLPPVFCAGFFIFSFVSYQAFAAEASSAEASVASYFLSQAKALSVPMDLDIEKWLQEPLSGAGYRSWLSGLLCKEGMQNLGQAFKACLSECLAKETSIVALEMDRGIPLLLVICKIRRMVFLRQLEQARGLFLARMALASSVDRFSKKYGRFLRHHLESFDQWHAGYIKNVKGGESSSGGPFDLLKVLQGFKEFKPEELVNDYGLTVCYSSSSDDESDAWF